MSSNQKHQKNPHKLSGVAKFFLGFSLGILLCVCGVFIVKNATFLNDIDDFDLFHNNQNELPEENPQQFKRKSKPINENKTLTTQDTTVLDSSLVNGYEDEGILEDAEFSFEPESLIDNVAEEKISQTKTIKVLVKNANLEDLPSIPDNIIAYFEVQKWESPIVNRISYQRNHNVLKIKGMDISKLSVFYINGKYFISDGSRLFSIPNNNTFEKLSEINIANL
ncbi:MAG TPA: hypothetical protein PLI77_05565 [Bacteroidales bacterium]|nr:hypothetical protein [Bacteroidales bacterium]